MTGNDPTPGDEWWTADDAFHYLTRVAKDRLPADEAIDQLTKKLLAGRVRAIRKFFVDGAPPNVVEIAASRWRHQLELIIVDGCLEVLQRPPSGGLLGAGVSRRASGVFLLARDIERRWPRRSTAATANAAPADTKTWLAVEVGRRQAAGDIPSGHGALTKFTEQIAKEMAEAMKARKAARALNARRIETLLHELELWPTP
jgi:hypothetical protein